LGVRFDRAAAVAGASGTIVAGLSDNRASALE
jgi:hypothetical protein